MLARAFPTTTKSVRPTYDTQNWLRGMVPLTINSLVGNLNNYIATLSLAILTTPEAIGLFRVASNVSSLAQFPQQGLKQIVAPEISRLWARQDYRRLQKIMKISGFLLFLTSSVYFLIVCFLGEYFISFAFGAEYSEGIVAAIILTLGLAVNSAFGYESLLLAMTNHASTISRVSVLISLVNVLLCLGLVSVLGLDGAAMGTAFSMIASGLILSAIGQRKTGIISGVIPFGGIRRGIHGSENLHDRK